MWRRRVANLLALLSLLACAATLTLALRGDQFVFTAAGRVWWIMFGGSLAVVTIEGWPGHEAARWIRGDARQRALYVGVERRVSSWERLGVSVEAVEVKTVVDGGGKPVSLGARDRGGMLYSSPPMRCREVCVPMWLVVVVTAALPAFRVARGAGRAVAARRRERAGTCASCGYDLRATPGRCPECGAVPVK